MYYHGSKRGNIKVLKPNYSMHGEKYVYLTTNKAVALIYTVNAIEKFYEDNNLVKPSEFQPWYSYGFNKDKLPRLEEYYPDAIKETYSKKSGYIYVCKKPLKLENPTNIYCAYVTKENVEILEVIFVEDVYQELLEYEKLGLLEIKMYKDNTEKFQNMIEGYIRDDIIKYKLLENPSNSYTIFLKSKFPHLFKQK